MKFGVIIQPDNLAQLPERARLAEEAGFDYLGVAESQSLARELYVSLSVVAQATKKVRIGPTVTNPLTRHPAVTASAIASINELSGGRAFLGIGTGNNSVLNLGLRPARLAQVKEYIEAVRTVLSGQSYRYQQRTIHVGWSRAAVPILVSAEGPRTLAMAGAEADAALFHTGLTSEVLRDSVERIREGERAAGKPEGSTEVWAFAKCSIAGRREQAIGEIKTALAGSAHTAFRFTLEGKHVPEALREPISTLCREYTSAQHEQLSETRRAALSDELGLTDYLADRFAVAGTPAQCREKTRAIQRAEVAGLFITSYGAQQEETIRRFGREVIAHFR
ncbi:MAG: LLM class flavin-dependent oxidoreductase [Dehalococcoidia bacterium]|jgi:5,10-methylenetetrahydromethanopterin reductase|nr:LLM class flavin-dependent oxidoreductase [Dehalococcoidia bacterium]MDP7201512.1 LLM class flavin-dependent oxidoreductase [Dehalococcoidia bacterium]HJN87657.1 LLM class flavin-dependent oxidoreductase [Dehalococcoidia bacterium]